MLALVIAAACEPVAPPTIVVSKPPTASQTLKFRLVAKVTHTLTGSYVGAGPVWEDFSTPAIGDISGDGQPEVVMASLDGQVIALRSDGSVL